GDLRREQVHIEKRQSLVIEKDAGHFDSGFAKSLDLLPNEIRSRLRIRQREAWPLVSAMKMGRELIRPEGAGRPDMALDDVRARHEEINRLARLLKRLS